MARKKEKEEKEQTKAEDKAEQGLQSPKRNIEGTWKPMTILGKKVLSGEIKNIDEAMNYIHPILESEIVDILIPNLQTDLLSIGQMKGKFGGGKRRAFRQTQKKTEDGSTLSFSTLAVVGNGDGYVGIGFGRSKETVPAREKALKKAKLNIFKIRRGAGSWATGDVKEATSIPFKVSGKCGSVEITLIPAPKGTGLCVEKECQKVLRLAGIKDVWSKTQGQTKVKLNLINACIDALKNLSAYKVQSKDYGMLGIVDGTLKKAESESEREFAESMAVRT